MMIYKYEKDNPPSIALWKPRYLGIVGKFERPDSGKLYGPVVGRKNRSWCYTLHSLIHASRAKTTEAKQIFSNNYTCIADVAPLLSLKLPHSFTHNIRRRCVQQV